MEVEEVVPQRTLEEIYQLLMAKLRSLFADKGEVRDDNIIEYLYFNHHEMLARCVTLEEGNLMLAHPYYSRRGLFERASATWRSLDVAQLQNLLEELLMIIYLDRLHSKTYVHNEFVHDTAFFPEIIACFIGKHMTITYTAILVFLQIRHFYSYEITPEPRSILFAILGDGEFPFGCTWTEDEYFRPLMRIFFAFHLLWADMSYEGIQTLLKKFVKGKRPRCKISTVDWIMSEYRLFSADMDECYKMVDSLGDWLKPGDDELFTMFNKCLPNSPLYPSLMRSLVLRRRDENGERISVNLLMKCFAGTLWPGQPEIRSAIWKEETFEQVLKDEIFEEFVNGNKLARSLLLENLTLDVYTEREFNILMDGVREQLKNPNRELMDEFGAAAASTFNQTNLSLETKLYFLQTLIDITCDYPQEGSIAHLISIMRLDSNQILIMSNPELVGLWPSLMSGLCYCRSRCPVRSVNSDDNRIADEALSPYLGIHEKIVKPALCIVMMCIPITATRRRSKSSLRLISMDVLRMLKPFLFEGLAPRQSHAW